MSKQEKIKQALAAASTEHEWDTDGTFIEWRDGCPLNGTYRKIAITQASTPEVFNNPNHENDAHLIAKAPEYIAYLLEEVEKWKALAEAKVVFASNGNDDYQYGLQEEVIRLAKELEKTCHALNAISMGEWACTFDDQGLEVWTTRRINPGLIAREALAVGQEGEGSQCK